jgi:hypothetical protein
MGGKRGHVRVLVQNGAVVAPVGIREMPTGAPAAAKGAPVPTKPVQEVTIAVQPDEVAALHEALAIQATLACVSRSGHADEANAATTVAGSTPPSPLHTLEVIAGSKRHTLTFASPTTGPRESDLGVPETGSTDQPSQKK